jgi:hypothetical protein
MNLPDWLRGEMDVIGQRAVAREITRQEAVTEIRDAIITKNDRAFMRSIVAMFAGKALDSWQREHRGAAASLPAQSQSDLFPDLPARLFIRPGTAKAVILFTGHDWDTAKAVLENRTGGAISAARADQAAFDAAYARVRPLLTGPGVITADVAEQIREAS